MKIAFVSTILDYPWGGADAMWTAAAEAASARGDAVLLAISEKTAASPRLQKIIARGAVYVQREKLKRTPLARVKRFAERRLSRPAPLIAALEAFKPDLVVISNGGTYDVLVETDLREWLYATGTRFHLIANWQRENPELAQAEREVVIPAFERAHGITFLSQRNLDVTRRHLLRPLPNATWRHTPLSDRGGNVLPWPSESTYKLATVARLEPVKGLDLLLHAAAAAFPRDARWEINMYGSGPDERYFRDIIAYLNLRDHVFLRGHRDLTTVWSENHILLSPALEEGGPMTLPEAMLRGRPVAATDIGGTDYWIEPGVTGFVTPAPTVPLLTALLRDVWGARESWRTFGERSATRAHALFRQDDYLGIIAPVA